jgi:hypothetical protein
MNGENVQRSTSNFQLPTFNEDSLVRVLPLEVGRWTLNVLLTLLAVLSSPAHAQDTASVIVAIGATGDDAFKGVFERWAGHWQKASAAGGAHFTEIGSDPKAIDSLTRLREALKAEATDSTAPLWLVLLGHGTFDGKEAKFNLRGDDVTAMELVEWLRPLKRPVVVVCGFSASGAFLKPLSAPGRVVVCATRSGSENNFARFGGYFSESIGDATADLDKDGQTSVLEAWLAAARQVTEFYKNEGRLATEHALLDDNADGLGTPPDWFQGVRAVKRSKSNQALDGLRANQLHLVASADERALSPEVRTERDALEKELAQLREAKSSLPEEEYFAKLEAIMLRIARLHRPER